MPNGKRVKVEYELELPKGNFTDDEIEEWLQFEIGENGSMSTKNRLDGTPIYVVSGTFRWEE